MEKDELVNKWKIKVEPLFRKGPTIPEITIKSFIKENFSELAFDLHSVEQFTGKKVFVSEVVLECISHAIKNTKYVDKNMVIFGGGSKKPGLDYYDNRRDKKWF